MSIPHPDCDILNWLWLDIRFFWSRSIFKCIHFNYTLFEAPCATTYQMLHSYLKKYVTNCSVLMLTSIGLFPRRFMAVTAHLLLITGTRVLFYLSIPVSGDSVGPIFNLGLSWREVAGYIFWSVIITHLVFVV